MDRRRRQTASTSLELLLAATRDLARADGELRHVPRHLGVARLDAGADMRAVETIQGTLERALTDAVTPPSR